MGSEAHSQRQASHPFAREADACIDGSTHRRPQCPELSEAAQWLVAAAKTVALLLEPDVGGMQAPMLGQGLQLAGADGRQEGRAGPLTGRLLEQPARHFVLVAPALRRPRKCQQLKRVSAVEAITCNERDKACCISSSSESDSPSISVGEPICSPAVGELTWSSSEDLDDFTPLSPVAHEKKLQLTMLSARTALYKKTSGDGQERVKPSRPSSWPRFRPESLSSAPEAALCKSAAVT
jgi:hypothetical protein